MLDLNNSAKQSNNFNDMVNFNYGDDFNDNEIKSMWNKNINKMKYIIPNETKTKHINRTAQHRSSGKLITSLTGSFVKDEIQK